MGSPVSLPKEFLQGTSSPFAYQGVTTPGLVQTLFSIVNDANANRDLYQLIVSCEFSGVVIVTVNGEFIGSGRTGPGEKQALISWNPPYPSLANETILVTFEQRPASPIVAVEAYFSTAILEVFS